jgi:hypothetical protein
MGDYNGRIGQIVRAFEQYPAGDLNTRMIVRETLAAERAEGFHAGYGEGIDDASAAQRSEQKRDVATLDAFRGVTGWSDAEVRHYRDCGECDPLASVVCDAHPASLGAPPPSAGGGE